MAEEQLLGLLREGESASLAFLPAHSRAQAVGETLVALANTHGGRLLLGVRTRQARLEGILSPEEARAAVVESAQACTPPLDLPTVEVIKVQGAAILLVTVPAGLPHVYHWQGRYLHRVKDRNVPLNETELRSLLLERAEEGFESLVPAGASPDDLDAAQVSAYAARLPAPPADPRERLLQRGCLASTPAGLRPTHAGLLLFGRNPQRYLPQARILLFHYPRPVADQAPLQQEARGTLPEQIRQAETFLQAHMHRGRMWADAERVEVTEYPLEAVREAIVNAVAHRDYSIRGDESRISIFPDHIEVYSPGRLPGPITVDNLLEERFSRNPAIAQLLADLGLMGHTGYGMDHLLALMQESHLPPPTYQEVRTGFLLTLHGPKGMPLGDIPADPQSLARLGLNERQVQVLLTLNEKGRITSREYQDLCPQVSGETLRRDLADLVSRGLILKVGESRATYYILR